MDSTEKKGNSFELQEEVFEFVLNVDNSRVSAHDLRLLLFHSERLVKSINKTLRKEYPDYQLGFDIVDLNVIALEKGSFNLKFSISEKNKKKLKEITHNPTFVAIVGAVIAGLFAAKPSTQVTIVNNENQETVVNNNYVTINNNIFLDVPATRDALDSISELVINSDTIHDFSINYQGEDKMEKAPISKEQLQNTSKNLQHRLLHKKAIIEYLSHDEDSYLWVIRYHGRIIHAYMHDPIFVEKIQLGEIDINRGDFYRVSLTTFYHGSRNVEYHIDHVIEHLSE
jgi:hypothetical protein